MNLATAYMLSRMIPKPVLIAIGLGIIVLDLIADRIDRRRHVKSARRR